MYKIERYRSPSRKEQRSYALCLPAAEHRVRDPILFLHGSGECGDDIRRAADSHGPQNAASQRGRSFVVIIPQLPKDLNDDRRDWLNFVDDIDEILRDVTRNYGIETDAPYLTGLSLGAEGTWELGATALRRWSAIAPFAGGCNEYSDPSVVAEGIGTTPTWAFVNIRETHPEITTATKTMVTAVEQCGGCIRHTYRKTSIPRHDCWTEAYRGDVLHGESRSRNRVAESLYDWFEHRRNSPAKSDKS